MNTQDHVAQSVPNSPPLTIEGILMTCENTLYNGLGRLVELRASPATIAAANNAIAVLQAELFQLRAEAEAEQNQPE